jgi:homoserine dehydrogenase
MKDFNVAILGCGTVGGGVARILIDLQNKLSVRTSKNIRLVKIVELRPKAASERFELPVELFCGSGSDLSPAEANRYLEEILDSPEIDLIVESIGGSNNFMEDLVIKILQSGKHLVTANKALLAERGRNIFEVAEQQKLSIGFEAAVCGAIPIIKTIRESFSGDEIISVSGIMNGTSNYILTMMQKERMEFSEALNLAQQSGYAEADPSLDINGGDARHKLAILMKLAFGRQVNLEQIPLEGIENIGREDIEYAAEIDAKLKLICFAKKINGKIYAAVGPMMVKNSNFLSEVNGATNAVRLTNRFGGKQILVGAGAGSFETASSIVADIVFAARYAHITFESEPKPALELTDARHFSFPYIISFETTDIPGITGLVATSIGKQKINIDTVSHNRRKADRATFSVVTMPCTMKQIEDAVEEIRTTNPGTLLSTPKVLPILY